MMNPTLHRQPFMRVSRFAIVATALAITIPLAVLAQSGTGTVSGTVVDSAGQAWAGARVVLSPVGQTRIGVALKTEFAKFELHDRHALEALDRTERTDKVQRIRLELEHADRQAVVEAKERDDRSGGRRPASPAMCRASDRSCRARATPSAAGGFPTAALSFRPTSLAGS